MKRKLYDSEDEFERDRPRMWAQGFTVAERRMVPGQRWRWDTLSTPDWFVWVLAAPLLLAGWLLFRNAPKERILVTYAKAGEFSDRP